MNTLLKQLQTQPSIKSSSNLDLQNLLHSILNYLETYFKTVNLQS
jgi:hypothetical protein